MDIRICWFVGLRVCGFADFWICVLRIAMVMSENGFELLLGQ